MMKRLTTVAILVVLVLATGALAGSNANYRFAVHIMPHETRTCSSNMPVITDCTQIVTTYGDCGEFDAFPVFYELTEVSRIEYGLKWPASWGSCIYTACAGDNVQGDIVWPGDGVIHEWNECQTFWGVVAGYAWFGPPAEPGIIVPTVNPGSGIFGVTDCQGSRDLAIGSASSGVCGIPGDDPCTCGCRSGSRTWSEVKALFK
jgi:hypothetical protein